MQSRPCFPFGTMDNPRGSAHTRSGRLGFWEASRMMFTVMAELFRGSDPRRENADSSARSRWRDTFAQRPRPSGNVAFDDWRQLELDELDRRRVELDRMLDEFDTYAADLRRAKDREEFDRFMSQRERGDGRDTPV